MSDGLTRWTLRAALAGVVLATIAAAAQPAAGQSLTQSLRRHRDLAIDAWTARNRADSLAVTSGRARLSDTIRANGVTLVTDHVMADSARRALIVMDSVLSWISIGHAAPPGASYQLRRDWADRRATDSSKVTWYLERADPQGHLLPVDYWHGPPESFEVGRKMAWDRRDLALQRLPPRFQTWLGASLMDSSLVDLWSSVYVRLATSPTLVAQRCFLGDIAGCRQALLLEPVKDPLTEWLSASTRRQMALTLREDVRRWAREEYQETGRDSVHADAMRCYDTADDAACTAFLRAFAGNVADDPLGNANGRQALVIAAIQMNGAPGFSAALERPSLGPGAAIESLSGNSLDHVVEAWRARVMAAKPERVVLTAPRVLAALGWTFGLGALALWGTRWR